MWINEGFVTDETHSLHPSVTGLRTQSGAVNVPRNARSANPNPPVPEGRTGPAKPHEGTAFWLCGSPSSLTWGISLGFVTPQAWLGIQIQAAERLPRGQLAQLHLGTLRPVKRDRNRGAKGRRDGRDSTSLQGWWQSPRAGSERGRTRLVLGM